MSTINLGNGNVNYTATISNSTITAGSGNDILNITGSSDTITAGGGNDSITISGNSDTITMGAGNNDAAVISGNNETITVGSGNDTISITGVAAGVTGTVDKITFGSGNDIIKIGGTTYNNTIVGGSGSNSITISGTSFDDSITLSSGASSVNSITISGTTDKDTITVAGGHNIINLTAAGTNDVITAGGGGNYIMAAGSGNSVVSGSGNDTLVYNPLDTKLNGGGGFDTLLVNAHYSASIDLTPSTSPVQNFQVIDLTGTALQNLADAGNSLILNVAAVDRLAGTSQNLFNHMSKTLVVLTGYNDTLSIGSGWHEHDVMSGANLTASENLLVGGNMVATSVTLSSYRVFTQGSDTLIVNMAPPQANLDNYSFSQTATVDSFAVPVSTGVLANDMSIGGLSSLSVTKLNGNSLVGGVLTANTAHGAVTLYSDGHFTYQETSAFNYLDSGADTFTYTVSDGVLSSSTTVNLKVTDTVVPNITGFNGVPVATHGSEAENTTGETWQVNLASTILTEKYSYALSDPTHQGILADFTISSTGLIKQIAPIDEDAVNGGTIVLGVQVTDTISHQASPVQSFFINVTDPDFDQTGTLTPSMPNINEGAAGVVANFSQAHPNGDDVFNSVFSVTNVTNPNNPISLPSTFFSLSNGMLSIAAAPEEGTYSYKVVLADAEGDHSLAIPLTITIADPDRDQTATLTPSSTNINEGAAGVVATVSQAHPNGDDVFNSVFSVTDVTNPNNPISLPSSFFSLSNGMLSIAAAPEEGTYSYQIVLADAEGDHSLAITLPITIADGDRDQTATLTPSSTNINEGTSGVVATVSQAHPNGDDVFNSVFSVTDVTNPNNHISLPSTFFSLSNGMLSIAAAPEEGTYSYQIVLADAEGDHSLALTLPITIADGDRDQTATLTPSSTNINEGASGVVATVSQAHPNGDDVFNSVFSVTNVTNPNNPISLPSTFFSLSNGMLSIAAAPEEGIYSYQIVLADAEGDHSLALTLPITIADGDRDQTGTLTPLAPINEGASGAVATLSQNHPNGDDVFTQLVSVKDVNNIPVTGNFSLSLIGGVETLSILQAPASGTYTYSVVVADSEGDHSQPISLTITTGDPGFVDNNASLAANLQAFAVGSTGTIANFTQDNSGDDTFNNLAKVMFDGQDKTSDFTLLSNGQLQLNSADGSIMTQGAHTLAITVQNGDGDSVMASTSIQVDSPPTEITLGGKDISATSFGVIVPTLTPLNSLFGMIAAMGPAGETFNFSLSENNNFSNDSTQYFNLNSSDDLVLQNAFAHPFDLYGDTTLTITASDSLNSAIKLQESFSADILTAPTKITWPTSNHLTMAVGLVGTDKNGATVSGNNTVSMTTLLAGLIPTYSPSNLPAGVSGDLSTIFPNSFDHISVVIPDPNFYPNTAPDANGNVPESIVLANGVTLTNPDSNDTGHILDNNSFITFTNGPGTQFTLHVEAEDAQGNLLAGDQSGSNDISVPVSIDSTIQAENIILHLDPSTITTPITISPIATVIVDTTSSQFVQTYAGALIVDTSNIANATYSFVQTDGHIASNQSLGSLNIYQGVEFQGVGPDHYISLDLSKTFEFVSHDFNVNTGVMNVDTYSLPLQLIATTESSYALIGPGFGLTIDSTHTLLSDLGVSGSPVLLNSGADASSFSGTNSTGTPFFTHNGFTDSGELQFLGSNSAGHLIYAISETTYDQAILHASFNDINDAANFMVQNQTVPGITDHNLALAYIQSRPVPLYTVSMIFDDTAHVLQGIEISSNYSNYDLTDAASTAGGTPHLNMLLMFGDIPSSFNLMDETGSQYKPFPTDTGNHTYNSLGGWIMNWVTAHPSGDIDTNLNDYLLYGGGLVESQPNPPAVVDTNNTTSLPESAAASLFNISNGGNTSLVGYAEIAVLAVASAAVIVATVGTATPAVAAADAAADAAITAADCEAAGGSLAVDSIDAAGVSSTKIVFQATFDAGLRLANLTAANYATGAIITGISSGVAYTGAVASTVPALVATGVGH